MPWSFFFRPVRIWTGLRLGRVLLALAFACGPTLAFSAGVNGSTGHLWNAPAYGNHIANDALSACAAGLAAYRAATGNDLGTASVIYGPVGGDPNHFVCQNDSGSGLIDVYQLTGPTSCAPGYTYQSDGSCKSNQPQCPASGSSPSWNVAYGTSSTQTVLGTQVCVGGCAYNFTNYWTGSAPGQTGYAAQYQGPISSTGNACTGSEAAGSSSPPNSNGCPAKTYQGTVNGSKAHSIKGAGNRITFTIYYHLTNTYGETTVISKIKSSLFPR